MSSSNTNWSAREDEDILIALKSINQYTYSAKEEIYEEAVKRKLLSEEEEQELQANVAAYQEFTSENEYYQTTKRQIDQFQKDLSKTQHLKRLTKICPWVLLILSAILGLSGITGLMVKTSLEVYYNAIIDVTLSIIILLLAWMVSKELKWPIITTLILLFVLIPLWSFMAFYDIAHDGILNSTRPVVFTILSLISIYCCFGTIRLKKN